MRRALLFLWLLIPLLVAAYHYGPGQDRTRLDSVDRVLARADRHAAAGEWAQAEEAYDNALAALPPGNQRVAWRARLERDKARMFVRKLPMAHDDLGSLQGEMQADPSADPALLDEVRAAHANSQYYMTWLMRLEGQPQDVWEPEIESARQTFRLLAERSETRGDDAGARRHLEDLESSIRLARMSLADLQGLPLPSQ